MPRNGLATTAADGTFEMTGLVAGNYEIYDVDRKAGSRYLYIAHGVRRPGGASAPVSVTANARRDITIRAWPAASISGRVIDERGRPVAGANVALPLPNSDRYGFATTDAHGRYRITDLLPGRYAAFVPVVGANRTIKVWAQLTAFFWLPWFPYLIDRGRRTVLFNYGAPLLAPSDDGRPAVFMSWYPAAARALPTPGM